MLPNKIRVLAFVLLCSTLSACGFHLRHAGLDLGAKYPTLNFPLSGSNTLHQALSRALLAANIHIIDPTPHRPSPLLRVVSQQISQQPLVYGPDGELRRERLKMAVYFSLTSLDGTASEFELSTERDRQLNNKQHLGDNAEKILIEQEMQADIIRQLLRSLASKN